MKRHAAVAVLSACLVARMVNAGIGDDPPLNPCPEADKFKTNLGILNVTGDGSLGVGPPTECTNWGFAETVIVCTSKEKTKNIDVAIQYFDNAGNLMSGTLSVGTNTFCAVPPGETLTFHTVPPGSKLPEPWNSVGGTPGFIPTTATVPVAPCSHGTTGCFLQGSARVLSTSNKIQCTATFLDIFGACFVDLPGAVATKNLTIITKSKQKGD